jgi:hypothetical protein
VNPRRLASFDSAAACLMFRPSCPHHPADDGNPSILPTSDGSEPKPQALRHLSHRQVDGETWAVARITASIHRRKLRPIETFLKVSGNNIAGDHLADGSVANLTARCTEKRSESPRRQYLAKNMPMGRKGHTETKYISSHPTS